MRKRTLILCVCLGVLLFFSAKTAVVFTSSAGGPSSVLSDSKSQPAPGEAEFDVLSTVYGSTQPVIEQPQVSPHTVDEGTLWLARAIYSETKLPHEQELVAWVVRNRVETGYRGQTTYREVVLDPYQFSAFNPGASKRSFYLSLTPEVRLSTWQQALWIAHYVRHADSIHRPFSLKTRHFYSQRSMPGRGHPYWASGEQFVTPGWDYQVHERRFRFYKEIS